jgi:hypothetical protein
MAVAVVVAAGAIESSPGYDWKVINFGEVIKFEEISDIRVAPTMT